MEYNIIQSYLTNNPRYKSPLKRNKIGYMQHSTGTPGAKVADFIKTWDSTSAQAEVEFIIDDTGIYQIMPFGIKTWHCGGSGNNTHVGCEICEPQATRLLNVNWLALSRNGKNNTKWAVTMLQRELTIWGYDPNGIDGNFGKSCEYAVKQFQKDHNLTVDGSVGKATLHELQKREDSLLLYNNVENQPYFEDVYDKAVFICAYVLNRLDVKNIDKNSVLSHAEGYKLGIASNHADVGHWFPQHGKNMDDFRADVITYINSGKLPYSKTTAFDKAVDAGLFVNVKNNDNITYGELSEILDKLNLLK